MASDMSCVALPKFVEKDVASADLSWEAIVESIRAHASRQTPELASELVEWADFVAGLSELQGE
jgi:hypothetical protein